MPGSSAGSRAGAGTARNATNAKHAGVLQEAGIVYDSPLNPVQVAAVRADRIAQKQKTAAAMAEQLQVQQQQQQPRTTVLGSSLPASVAAVASATLAPNSPVTPMAAARLTPIPVTSPSPATLTTNQIATTNPSNVGTTVVMSSIGGTPTTVGQHAILLQTPTSTTIQPITVDPFFIFVHHKLFLYACLSVSLYL